MLDNIGLPYSGINTSYSNSGTIGTSDAEILVSLTRRPPSDGRVRAQVAGETAASISRSGVLLSASGHRESDPEFRIACPGRYPTDRHRLCSRIIYIAQEIANQLRHIPGAVDVHVQQMMNNPTLLLDVDRVRAQQVGITERDVAQQPAGLVEWQFPDLADVLAESEKLASVITSR